jgi:parvulin-like peptidyl-prolyl isomerase
MYSSLEVAAVRLGDQVISLATLLRNAPAQEAWKRLLDVAVERLVVVEAARRAGLSVTVPELQQAFDTFRRVRGLLKAADTTRWMESHHLTLEDMQEDARVELLREKLAQRVADPQVDRWFHEHRSSLAEVALARVVVAEENLAAELLAEIEEGEKTFDDIVPRHSIDTETSWRGGYWRTFRRPELSGEVSAAVFGAAVGGVVGPFRGPEGWALLRVVGRREGTLDRARIRTQLLQEHLDQVRREMAIQLEPGG